MKTAAPKTPARFKSYTGWAVRCRSGATSLGTLRIFPTKGAAEAYAARSYFVARSALVFRVIVSPLLVAPRFAVAARRKIVTGGKWARVTRAARKGRTR